MKKIITTSLIAASLAAFATSANGAALIYEPFAQDTSGGTDTALAGKAGGTGLNTWAEDGSSSDIQPEGLSYGNLQHTGGELNMIGNNHDAYVTTTSAIGDAGLLDDGATLWFSFMYSKTNSNGGNEKGSFSFGSERIDSAYNGSNMINGGNAIGAYIAEGGTAQAASWNGDGNFSGGTGSAATANDTSYMIVGQINWGATLSDDEMITLYFQDTSNLGTLSSSISTRSMTGVDQTQFDTISMGTHQSLGTITYDEIRFGATFADVSTVPEPSAALLGALGVLALLRRRR